MPSSGRRDAAARPSRPFSSPLSAILATRRAHRRNRSSAERPAPRPNRSSTATWKSTGSFAGVTDSSLCPAHARRSRRSRVSTPRNAEAFIGEQATEERAKAVGKNVPLIHYACHAYVNERFPLDSALVFTIPDKPKEGQDNGLLQAWEIFEKVRIDADLVTLSACETGLGKEMGGEGLIGLTRAFQYAGARSVLASLWRVEDASTGELMERFYGHLRTGKTKDEALRLAQIDLIRSADFAQPKDWAAFQLNGDWK